MSDPPLWVFHERRVVGRLDPSPLAFAYDADWLASSDAFPASVTLPLAKAPYAADAVAGFFFNLLPEGRVRRQIAERLGISVGNDYALLAAIGGECAGALSLVPSREDALRKPAYQRLTDADIAERIESGGAFGSVAGARGIRLSLAGAQDKLPVFIDEDGIALPKATAASTHILKFENRDFRNLPANEVLLLRLAAAVGLPTVRAELRRIGRHTTAVIERYDREVRAGAIARIHQEDFCQAQGFPAERKYEAEGGPSISQCVELVRAASVDPLVDTRALIRWHIFNACVGNADGHAKNLSLLHSANGTRLAPFYDLVCTRAYRRIDRHIAMRIGSSVDADRLRRSDWQQFARDIGVGERFVVETAEEIVGAVSEHTDPALRALEREFRRQEFLRSEVVPAIRAASRRVALSLRPVAKKR